MTMATVTKQTKLIDLGKLTLDDRIQTREVLDENLIDQYANDMADGDKFPEPVVFFDGSTYWVASGFHRYFATKMTGAAGIKIDIRTGTLRDAIWFAAGENATHGRQRTIGEKRRAVQNILNALDETEAATMTDREIGRITKTSHTFVAEVRRPPEKPAKGTVATPRDKPTSKPGVVISDPPKPTQKVASGNVASQAPVDNPDDGNGEDPVAVLSAEIDHLKRRLELGAAEGYTDEEKVALAESMEQRDREFHALQAERDSIAAQRDAYMNENGELKREVTRLRRKLDQAAKK